MKDSTISSWRRAGQTASLRLTLGIVMTTVSVSAQAAREWDRLRTVTTAVATSLWLTLSTQWAPSLTPR